jgi:hypothetical protein
MQLTCPKPFANIFPWYNFFHGLRRDRDREILIDESLPLSRIESGRIVCVALALNGLFIFSAGGYVVGLWISPREVFHRRLSVSLLDTSIEDS